MGGGRALVVLAALALGCASRSRLPAAPPVTPHYDVRILRDDFGVPHVFGKTDADAAFGLAYAHAEDDFVTIQDVLFGVRGMAAMGRASRFGTVPDFYRAANQSICVIVQIETPQAAAQLEAIAAVPGVDGIFVGPADLSGAMGLTGQLTHPEVMAVMADCAQRARKLGKPIGTVGGTPEVVTRCRAMGYDFVAIASDLGLLMRGAQAAVQALRTADSDVHVHTLQDGTKTEGGY